MSLESSKERVSDSISMGYLSGTQATPVASEYQITPTTNVDIEGALAAARDVLQQSTVIREEAAKVDSPRKINPIVYWLVLAVACLLVVWFVYRYTADNPSGVYVAADAARSTDGAQTEYTVWKGRFSNEITINNERGEHIDGYISIAGRTGHYSNGVIVFTDGQTLRRVHAVDS